jgi:hypothetical protein
VGSQSLLERHRLARLQDWVDVAQFSFDSDLVVVASVCAIFFDPSDLSRSNLVGSTMM